MPRPPISTLRLLAAASRSQASVASASSEPLRRLFISSFGPSMIENSVPRRMQPQGAAAVGNRSGVEVLPGDHAPLSPWPRPSHAAIPVAAARPLAMAAWSR